MQLCYLCRQTFCKVIPLTFVRFIGYKLNCHQSGILPEMCRDLCFHFDLKSNVMACELITWFFEKGEIVRENYIKTVFTTIEIVESEFPPSYRDFIELSLHFL